MQDGVVSHFVEHFAGDSERHRPELRAASIGPVTTAELREHGVEPAAEAARPSDEGMVEAVVQAVRDGERKGERDAGRLPCGPRRRP